MNNLDTAIRDLLAYYYLQSEEDGGTDWDKLDDLIYRVKTQYEKLENSK